MQIIGASKSSDGISMNIILFLMDVALFGQKVGQGTGSINSQLARFNHADYGDYVSILLLNYCKQKDAIPFWKTTTGCQGTGSLTVLPRCSPRQS